MCREIRRRGRLVLFLLLLFSSLSLSLSCSALSLPLLPTCPPGPQVEGSPPSLVAPLSLGCSFDFLPFCSVPFPLLYMRAQGTLSSNHELSVRCVAPTRDSLLVYSFTSLSLSLSLSLSMYLYDSLPSFSLSPSLSLSLSLALLRSVSPLSLFRLLAHHLLWDQLSSHLGQAKIQK